MKTENEANAVSSQSLNHVQELEYLIFWHQQVILQL